MLKQRVLTAAVLGSITLVIILSGSGLAFSVLMGWFVLLGGWEWAGLCGNDQRTSRMLYAAGITGLGILIVYSLPKPWLNGISLFGALWWCLASLMVCIYATGKRIIPENSLTKYLVGGCVLLPAAISLIELYSTPRGPFWVLWLFLLIWIVDSAAYFAGRRWGKRRLMHRVSPGKTWEGLAGSLVAAVIMALVCAEMSHNTVKAATWLALLFIVTTGFSVIGDLFESMFKRDNNVKDSGQLLPGHGGVLDRIDSLTAAAPIYTLGLWLLEAR